MNSPYVGPIPFDRDHTLFGRDTELEELQWRLIADRIIVLYSPSGAGKTSLLMARNGLLEKVRDRFQVIDGLRIGNGGGTDLIGNVLGRLATDDCQPRPGDTLASFVERRPVTAPDKRLLLVFDQFEEVFTCGASEKQQQQFFEQLGTLLSQGRVPAGSSSEQPGRSAWAIFSMREEYFSWLDPFRELLPTRLNNTFRLTMLGTEQAIEAVRRPAQEQGVSFPEDNGEDAASVLVKRMGSRHIRTPDGKEISRQSGTVEPVHLQVVWTDIWQRVSEAGSKAVSSIQVADVRNYPLETPLQDYCEKALASATHNVQQGQRLRDWIDRRLLSLDGLRVARRLDPDDDIQPPAQELAVLEDAHLIRQYSRDDGQWFELAHDRLARPVRDAIKAWRKANLAIWRILAEDWSRKGEPPAFLRGLPREIAKSIPKETDGQGYNAIEVRFANTFHRERQRKKFLTGLVVGFAVLVAGVLLVKYRTDLHLLATQRANVTQIGLLAILEREPAPDLGNLAALMGMQLQQNHPDWTSVNFQRLLGDQLSRARGVESTLLTGQSATRKIAQDERFLIIADIGPDRHAVKVFAVGGKQPPQDIDAQLLKETHPTGIRSIAMAGDGYFLLGDLKGQVSLWRASDRQKLMHFDTQASGSEVTALAWMNDKLFAGHRNGDITAWSIDVAAVAATFIRRDPVRSRVSDLSPFNHGNSLAVTDISDLDAVTLLNYNATPKRTKLEPALKQTDYLRAYYSVAISPDEQRVAASNRAGQVHVWNLQDKSLVTSFTAHGNTIAQMHYLPDGSLLTASWDGSLKRWTFSDNRQPVEQQLNRFAYQLMGLSIDRKRHQAFISSEQGDVMQISLDFDRHSLGRRLPGTSSVFDLVKSNGSLELMTAMSNELKRYRVSSIEDTRTVAKKHNVEELGAWSIPAVRSISRAEIGKAYLVTTQYEVFLIPDQADAASADKPIWASADAIEWVRTDEQGQRLLVKTAIGLKALIATKQPGVWCEASFSTGLGKIQAAAFRPGSSEFVIASGKKLETWSLPAVDTCDQAQVTKTGQAFPEGAGDILAIGFSPSGDTLWVGTFTGEIFSVDIHKSSAEKSVLEGSSTLEPTAIAASNDTLAVGGSDGRLFVYLPEKASQPRGGQGLSMPLLLTQNFHTSPIRALGISPDGHWLVSSSDTGTAVWDLRLESWQKKACKLVHTRAFSQQEIDRYFKSAPPGAAPCPPTI